MLIQRDAVVRQSSILITNAMSDNQMQMALMEIEKLTKELETMKREHREKVRCSYRLVKGSSSRKKDKNYTRERSALVIIKVGTIKV